LIFRPYAMADSKSQHQIMLFLEKAHNLRQKTL
jgi:hypothetical protein